LNFDVLQLLCEKGVNVNHVDRDGDCAFKVFLDNFDKSYYDIDFKAWPIILKILIKYGYDARLMNQ